MLKESRTQLKEMEETRRLLQQAAAAGDDVVAEGSAWQRAKTAAADLVKKLPQLVDHTWLLSSQGTCSLQLDQTGSGAYWAASVPLEGDLGHLLKYLMLLLLRKGELLMVRNSGQGQGPASGQLCFRCCKTFELRAR